MRLQRWRHGRRCRQAARDSTQPVLSRYLQDCADLSIGRIDETPLIAVDLELTGLDKRRERIVAMGWTRIDGGRIRFEDHRRLLLRSDRPVGDSALVHGLTDTEVESGVPVGQGLEALFEAARGRLWVMHHAGLDVAFLKRACAAWAGVVPGFIVLDTLRIEYRLRLRREIPVKQGDLQLDRIRGRYGLPPHATHDALGDAVATAELMIAIAAGMADDEPLALAPHVKFF